MINKIIISDTSCLIALDRINKLEILDKLFSFICTTEEIKKEFGKTLPEWINIKRLKHPEKKMELQQIVDEGEASAIALALENEDCILIIDEKKGRKLAEQLKIEIAGTLQVLLLAKSRGIISSLRKTLKELEECNFRFSIVLKEEMLRKAGE